MEHSGAIIGDATLIDYHKLHAMRDNILVIVLLSIGGGYDE
jgi:hypothetical protein